MPYIPQARREFIYIPANSGELNFMITELVTLYIKAHEKKYATLNEAIGALECAKLELYRRVLSPYEDKKIKQNGDVYGDIL